MKKTIERLEGLTEKQCYRDSNNNSLPDSYSKATGDEKCSNCEYFNYKMKKDKKIWCERWEDWVEDGYWCDEWDGK